MTDETKHENATGHGGFERQDLQPSGVLYFLLGLGVAILLCILGIRGLFVVLDHREKAEQPAVNPLVTNVPMDTRHIPRRISAERLPQPEAGGKRARPTEWNSITGRKHSVQLRLGR